jgi:hypothetical protein
MPLLGSIATGFTKGISDYLNQQEQEKQQFHQLLGQQMMKRREMEIMDRKQKEAEARQQMFLNQRFAQQEKQKKLQMEAQSSTQTERMNIMHQRLAERSADNVAGNYSGGQPGAFGMIVPPGNQQAQDFIKNSLYIKNLLLNQREDLAYNAVASQYGFDRIANAKQILDTMKAIKYTPQSDIASQGQKMFKSVYEKLGQKIGFEDYVKQSGEQFIKDRIKQYSKQADFTLEQLQDRKYYSTGELTQPEDMPEMTMPMGSPQ